MRSYTIDEVRQKFTSLLRENGLTYNEFVELGECDELEVDSLLEFTYKALLPILTPLSELDERIYM